MVDLLEKSNDIIKVLFFTDIIFLIVSFFYISKGFLLTSMITNIILLGSFLVLKKYSAMFAVMSETQKASSGLNKILGKLYG